MRARVNSLITALLLGSFGNLNASADVVYGFGPGCKYTYRLEHGITGKEKVSAILEVVVQRMAQQAKDKSEEEDGEAQIAGPYYMVDFRIHSARCRISEQEKRQDWINQALASIEHLVFRLEINRHGYVRRAAMDEVFGDLPGDIDKKQMESTMIAREVLQPMVALVVKHLFPCIRKDKGRHTIAQRDWDEANQSVFGNCLGEETVKLQSIRVKKKSIDGVENSSMLLWKICTDVVESQALGYERDRKRTVEQKYYLSPLHGVFDRVEHVLREEVVTDSTTNGVQEVFFRCLLIKVDGPRAVKREDETSEGRHTLRRSQ